jgi:hypothetical protein
MSYTFFGLQIAIQSPPGDPWREALVALVRRNLRGLDLVEKRALFFELAELLRDAEDRWALGTWDLVQGARAESEFDSWVSGLETSADEPLDPSAAAGDHVVVSVVVLVEPGSRSDTTLGERCDLPESAWHARSTFERLVATLRSLSFSGVRADGVYVVPGDVGGGIALAELRGEGWDYLKPLG